MSQPLPTKIAAIPQLRDLLLHAEAWYTQASAEAIPSPLPPDTPSPDLSVPIVAAWRMNAYQQREKCGDDALRVVMEKLAELLPAPGP